MITRLVKLTLKNEYRDSFLGHFETVKHRIRAVKGCRFLDLLSDVDDPMILFTYSIWDSVEDLDNYTDSDLFRNIWKEVKPMFGAKAEAWSTEIISDTGPLS